MTQLSRNLQRRGKQGAVYFIAPEAVLFRKEPDLRRVKIGFTTGRPSARLNALQTGSPVTLELLGWFRADKVVESYLHQTFAPLQSHGEWFYVERKLQDFLCYFDDLPPLSREVPEAVLDAAVSDVLLAECSSHPSMSDEDYLDSAKPQHLQPWLCARWGAS